MINLKFTAMTISEIEDEKNESIIHIFKDMRLSTLALVISKGAKVDITEAYKKIDEYIKSGKSTEDLYVDILEAVHKDGFLPKEMNCESMRKSLAHAKEQMKKQLEN